MSLTKMNIKSFLGISININQGTTTMDINQPQANILHKIKDILQIDSPVPMVILNYNLICIVKLIQFTCLRM